MATSFKLAHGPLASVDWAGCFQEASKLHLYDISAGNCFLTPNVASACSMYTLSSTEHYVHAQASGLFVSVPKRY